MSDFSSRESHHHHHRYLNTEFNVLIKYYKCSPKLGISTSNSSCVCAVWISAFPETTSSASHYPPRTRLTELNTTHLESICSPSCSNAVCSGYSAVWRVRVRVLQRTDLSPGTRCCCGSSRRLHVRHSRAGTELTDNLCRITRKKNIRNRKQNRTIILGHQGPCKNPPRTRNFKDF